MKVDMENRKRFNYIGFIILAVGTVFMIFPFFWMILSSFKTVSDVYSYPPKWMPSHLEWSNYAEVFRMIPFALYYFNSVFTSVMQTFLQISICIAGAYAFAVLDFPFKKSFLVFVRSTMFVPEVVTLIPLYLLCSRLGLIDTYVGIIFPQLLSAFILFLLLSFFFSIPGSLYDSAKIDGCGYYRILWNVVIPNSRSAIATAMMFSFLGHWKSYTWPLIITNREVYRTLPIGLKYLVQESSNEYQVMMAASVMAIVPVLAVFFVFEKQLIESITLTGLKN